jgi:glutamate dehydrogenase (NADP+)
MSIANDVYAKVVEKDPGQKEFHQAVLEVLKSIEVTAKKHPEYVKFKIFERIVEPDRMIMFRVPWTDDKGEVQVNRGFRVQFNNAIGPYKGGLRFHPTVNLGIIKFLGFARLSCANCIATSDPIAMFPPVISAWVDARLVICTAIIKRSVTSTQVF